MKRNNKILPELDSVRFKIELYGAIILGIAFIVGAILGALIIATNLKFI
jgi:hypothetical protein